MKSFGFIIVILVGTVALMGMGSLGGQPQGTAPKTEVNIHAQIVDRSGVTTEVAQFSMEGKVYLEGARGDGQMTVLFKKLQGIAFGKVEGQIVPAELKFKNGENLKLKLRKSSVFYGSTRYGTFQIRAGNIQKIEFLPTATQG